MPAIQIAWIFLGVGFAAEVLGTIGLKISAGFTRLLPTGLALAVARLTVLHLSESPP